MAFAAGVLVIVLHIHVANLSLRRVNPERQTAVAGHAQTLHARTVAGQSVHVPRWQRAQFLAVLHLVQERQHFAELIGRIGWNAFRVIFRVEPFQALMGEVPRFHSRKRSL